ncbi:MAG: hypothetical protein AAGA67_11340 [Cyanobacteria bacterium P01_F01_bin.153]
MKGTIPLAGDFGDDTLFGSFGNDAFILGAGRSSDKILDYTDSIDGFLPEPILTFEQLTFEASDNSTQVKFGDEALATVIGVVPGFLEASDFTALS